MITAASAFAQYNSKVYNLYLDFNEEQYEHHPNLALQKADSILNSSEKLPQKAQTNFYRSLAKLYEDQHQYQKSILFNEKVVAAVPDYYVSHRALGYLYLRDTDNLVDKMNQSASNPANYKKYQSQYFMLLKKALPHLEKAEACDHDDDTLNLIKSLYQKLDDQKDIASLSSRLIVMRQHCVDLLTD